LITFENGHACVVSIVSIEKEGRTLEHALIQTLKLNQDKFDTVNEPVLLYENNVYNTLYQPLSRSYSMQYEGVILVTHAYWNERVVSNIRYATIQEGGFKPISRNDRNLSCHVLGPPVVCEIGSFQYTLTPVLNMPDGHLHLLKNNLTCPQMDSTAVSTPIYATDLLYMFSHNGKAFVIHKTLNETFMTNTDNGEKVSLGKLVLSKMCHHHQGKLAAVEHNTRNVHIYEGQTKQQVFEIPQEYCIHEHHVSEGTIRWGSPDSLAIVTPCSTTEHSVSLYRFKEGSWLHNPRNEVFTVYSNVHKRNDFQLVFQDEPDGQTFVLVGGHDPETVTDNALFLFMDILSP